MLLVAGYYEKWIHTYAHKHTHTHTRSQFVSVYVANHPHILVLSHREEPEDKQQLLSHHFTLTFITLALPPITLSFSFFHISSTFQPFCHCSLPCRAPLYLSSQCCIDLHELSPAISPYLLIPTLSLLYLAGLFPFSHKYTIFLSISTYSLLWHSLY